MAVAATLPAAAPSGPPIDAPISPPATAPAALPAYSLTLSMMVFLISSCFMVLLSDGVKPHLGFGLLSYWDSQVLRAMDAYVLEYRLPWK